MLVRVTECVMDCNQKDPYYCACAWWVCNKYLDECMKGEYKNKMIYKNDKAPVHKTSHAQKLVL